MTPLSFCAANLPQRAKKRTLVDSVVSFHYKDFLTALSDISAAVNILP
jgi:hypothetical protein